MNIEKIFSHFPWISTSCWNKKSFLWPDTFFGKDFMNIKSFICIRKNACSIPECEHCIDYILNILKYYRIRKKDIANTFQIFFLQYVRVPTMLSITFLVFVSLLKRKKKITTTNEKSGNICPILLIVLY